MKLKSKNQLGDALRGLQDALTKWEAIPEENNREMEEFKQKTRDLLKKLQEQIKTLNL